jgi:hypothetical protein
MSDDRDPGIDPRFDPAFQRGFDPASPIEESIPAPAPSPARSPQPPTGPAVAAPPPAPTVVAPPDGDLATARAEPVAIVALDEPVVDGPQDASPSRNPFLLFLGIIAIALVGAGIWLFVRSGDAFNSREVRSQGDYMSLDATIHMAPFIALLGGATAIGILFVFAARWRGRR